MARYSCVLPVGVARAHDQRTDQGGLGGGEALAQALLAKLVHQEADRAAMHAVERLARGHELVQGPQHESVAAERHDDVGLLGLGVAVAAHQRLARLLGLRRLSWPGRRSARSGRGDWTSGSRWGEGMERAVFVYTTYPSIVEAEKAGRALLERALAACVNILPGMVSLYRWQGAIERGEEAVMIIKTRASLAEAGARGRQGDALLRDAGDPGDSARERRPRLSGLDAGRDRGPQGLTRGGALAAVRCRTDAIPPTS